MSIILIEGFDAFLNQAEFARVDPNTNGSAISYTPTANSPTVEFPEGRLGGKALKWVTGSSTSATTEFILPFNQPLTTISGTYTFSFACYIDSALTSTSTQRLLSLGTSDLYGVALELSGGDTLIHKTRNAIGSTLTATMVTGLPQDTWFFLEFAVVVESGTGTYRPDSALYINGTLVYSDTEALMRESPIGTALGLSFREVPGLSLDDLHVTYRPDIAFPTDPRDLLLGDARVETFFPTADVVVTGLVGDGGETTDLFNLVDTFSDDYIEEAATSTSYLFGSTGTLSDNPIEIHAIAVNQVSRRTSSQLIRMDSVISDGTTEVIEAGVGVGNGFTATIGIIESNPFTTTAWTRADVEGLDFGFRPESI